MSNNMYVYTTSQNDVLYVRNDGELRLIACVDQTELIETGMEAAGADIVHIESPIPAIEEGIDITVITDEVGTELSKRIMAHIDAED